VPHSFALFANEWASVNKGEAHTVPPSNFATGRALIAIATPEISLVPGQSLRKG